jgi:hypothetical protein
MGMFDTIVCKYSLPMPEDPKGYMGLPNFQTKDFECGLQEYTIQEDGSLWIEKRKTEYVPGNPNAKSFLDRMGHMKTLESWLEPHKITQTIHMYDYQQNRDGDYDYSIEYQATFVEGTVTNIKLVDFEAIDNKERKQKDKEHFEQMRLRIQFEQKFYYKYFLKYYNKSLSFVCYYIYKMANVVSTNIWDIERKLTV